MANYLVASGSRKISQLEIATNPVPENSSSAMLLVIGDAFPATNATTVQITPDNFLSNLVFDANETYTGNNTFSGTNIFSGQIESRESASFQSSAGQPITIVKGGEVEIYELNAGNTLRLTVDETEGALLQDYGADYETFLQVQPSAGDVHIKRNTVISGSLTVQEVFYVFETASILNSSGSTIFGNSGDDTHTFSGSILLSGSLAIIDGATLDGVDLSVFSSSVQSESQSFALRLTQDEADLSLLSSSYETFSGSQYNADSSSFSADITQNEGDILLLSSSYETFSGSQYQTDSGSVSTRLTDIEIFNLSVATTGSNTFVGDQVISGSLTVSGSSTFRNIGLAEFTGSLNISGSGITLNENTNLISTIDDGGSIYSVTLNADGLTFVNQSNDIMDIATGPGGGSINAKAGKSFVITTDDNTYAWQFNDDGDLNVDGNIDGAPNLATTGSNTFVGDQVISGSLLVSGSSTFTNIGLAKFTGSLNSSGSLLHRGKFDLVHKDNNVIVGRLAGNDIDQISTNYNTALGTAALYQLSTGSYNTAIGSNAMWSATDLERNTAVGYLAGSSLGNGSTNNVLLGISAGPTSQTVSDRLYINNKQSNTPLIYGEFTNTPFVTIHGSLNVTSSIRVTGSIEIVDGETIDGVDISVFKSDIDTETGSLQSQISQNTGDILLLSGSYETASGSFSTRVTQNTGDISILSASFETTSSKLIDASGSFSTRVTNNELTGSDHENRIVKGTNAVTSSAVSSSYIDLDVLANGDIPAHKAGRIFFGSEDGALEVYNEVTDFTLQVGQEFVIRAYNLSGGVIGNGTPVFASGSQGDRIGIYPATAEDHTSSPHYDNHILGIATHEIGISSEGYVTAQGIVRGIDTQNFTAGDILYLQTGSPATPEDYYRNTPPPFPYDIVQVGYVARSAANGFVFAEPKEPVHFNNISGLSGSDTPQVGDLWVYQPNGGWTTTHNLTGSYTIGGDLLPETTEVHDLGSPTQRWRDLYLSGSTIDLGGLLIQRGGDGNVQFIDSASQATKSVNIDSITGSLTVSGSEINLIGAESGDVPTYFNITRGDGLGFQVYDNPVDSASTLHSSGIMNFRASGSNRMSIDENNVTILTGNLKINTAGKGIDFSATSDAGGMTSELLDDYEEGTWTPVYIPSTGTFATMTMDTQTARYTKIGNMVTIFVYMKTDNVDVTGGSGSVYIDGLPFAVGVFGGGIALGVSNNFTNAADGGYFVSGTTLIQLTKSGASTEMTVADLSTGANNDHNNLLFTATYFV